MAARSSAKPFHLASFLFFPLLIKRKWFTAFRPIPILKLHSPSLPVQVCLSANHPAIWHLLLYVKKQYFFTKISQFLDSTFHHVWDELQRGHWSSTWKTSQGFLKVALRFQISRFSIHLLTDWKTKLLNSYVFKLVCQSLVMQYFSSAQSSVLSSWRFPPAALICKAK